MYGFVSVMGLTLFVCVSVYALLCTVGRDQFGQPLGGDLRVLLCGG